MDKDKQDPFSKLKNELKKDIPQKPNISLTFNEDSTEAYLTITPTSGNIDLKPEYIDEIIRKNQITYGIKKDLSTQLVKNFLSQEPIKAKKYIIARGKKPKDTKPTSVKLLSQEKELIMEGEIIGEIIPEVNGKFGIDVHGKRITPRLDRTGLLEPGENTALFKEEEKTYVKSEIIGVLFIDKDKHEINIYPEEDGKFKIFIDNQSGVVSLSVYPPIGRKTPVETSNVYAQIRELKITEIIDPKAIEFAINAGKTDKMIDYQIGKGKPENYDIKITISDDKMKAYIDIIRPTIPNHILTEKEILKELQKAGVIKGYTSEVFKEITQQVNEKRESISNRKIAEGEEPLNEEKDFIDYRVELIGQDIEFTIKDENGKEIRKKGDVAVIDHSNELICYLVKGTVRGQEGFTITGEKLLPERNVPINLKAGRNVYKSKEDEGKIAFYSKIGGNVYFYDNHIHIIDN
jgi:uncharacterized protein (DUF342 family)